MRNLIRINEPCIGKEEIDSVTNVLKSGILAEKSGSGPNVLEFEMEFAEYVKSKHAVAVSSGTAALHSALMAAGVGAGDQVIVPSFSFSATAEAVLLAGAKPVFADINPVTYCMDAECVEKVITRRTRAIIPVHLYGLPADMDPIIEIARENDVVIIEDAAQAHGASYKGKMVGAIGDMTCFSFYAGKNITTGEGGMVTTNDDDYAEALRIIRTHGEKRPYWTIRLGSNYRMSEIQAAIGVAQLKKLPLFLKRRRENAEVLTERLENLGKLALPGEGEGLRHSWYLYTVRLIGANAGKRNKLVGKLNAKNIEARVYYETPIHMLPLYRETLGYKRGALPEAEKAARQVFSLPVHPKVSLEDLNYIADTLRKMLS